MMTELEAVKQYQAFYERNYTNSLTALRDNFDDFITRANEQGQMYFIASWEDFQIEHHDKYATWSAIKEHFIVECIEKGYDIGFAYDGIAKQYPSGLIVCWGNNKTEKRQELEQLYI